MVVSAGYVLILNMLDTTVKSIEDIEELTNYTVIASLPMFDSEMSRKSNRSKKERGGK